MLAIFFYHFFCGSFDRALLNIPALIYSPINNAQNMVLCAIAAAIIFCLLQIYIFVSNKGFFVSSLSFNKRQWLTFVFLLVLFAFVGGLIYTSSYWTMHDMGNVRFDQIIYIMSQSLRETDPLKIREFIVKPLLSAVGFASVVGVFVYFFATHQLSLRNNRPIKKRKVLSPIFLFLAVLLFSSGLTLGIREVGYEDVKAYYFEDTEVYDDYYVDPSEQSLQFPQKKRNLVYIFLESMESSYADKEIGGIEEKNLIPRLTDLTWKRVPNFLMLEKGN